MGKLSDVQQAAAQLDILTTRQSITAASAERFAREAEERLAKLYRKVKKTRKALNKALDAMVGRRVYLLLGSPEAIEVSGNVDDVWLPFPQHDVWTGSVEKAGISDDKGAYLEFYYPFPDGEVHEVRVYARHIVFGLIHAERPAEMNMLALLMKAYGNETFRDIICDVLEAQVLE